MATTNPEVEQNQLESSHSEATTEEHAGGHSLGLQPDVLFHIGPAPITNAHAGLFAVTLLLAIFGLWVSRTSQIIPSRGQAALETVLMFFKEKVDLGIEDPKKARFVLTLISTIFLVILISNQFAVFPFLSVMFGDHFAFRVPTTHLAFPVALGLFVLVLSHLIALTISPTRHLGHYIKIGGIFKIRSVADLLNWLLESFLALLEIIEEFAKLISISARLFGNIFAGELMAIVVVGISTYTGFVVPIPLYVLGIFVGIIQAAVFSLLSIQYLTRAIKGASHAH